MAQTLSKPVSSPLPATTPSLLVAPPAQEVPARGWALRAALVVAVGYVVLVTVMIGVGLVLVHPLHGTVGRWDEHVNVWLARRRTTGWDTVTDVATWFANTVPAIGLAAVIVAVCAVYRRWREAVMIVMALTLELCVFLTVNAAVDRPRPHVVRLNSTPSTSSFPSGHTAAATVIFAGLAIVVTCCTRRRAVRGAFVAVAIVVATLVGFGRVYRGLHHPTDVLAGAVLGMGCLAVAILAIRTKEPALEVPTERSRQRFERALEQ